MKNIKIILCAFFVFVSCKKEDLFISNQIKRVNIFEKRDNSNQIFNKINGILSDVNFLDQVIASFNTYEKVHNVSGILKKFGKPNWDISIVIKNENGFNTLVTPVINDENNTNALIFFYKYSRDKILFKIVSKNDKQPSISKYGSKEGIIFSESTLLGLFNVSNKNIHLLNNLEKSIHLSTNNIANNGLIISYICWDYTWSYSNSDGSVVVGVMPQCSYQFTINLGDIINMDGGSDYLDDINCAENCAMIFTDLVSNSMTASYTVSTQVGDVDDFRKSKIMKWVILTNPTFQLISIESGIVKLVDKQSNIWNWESLTHQNITMAGNPIGGAVSFNQGVGTPSFVAGTPNVLYAGMSLDFNVTYHPICNCSVPNLLDQSVNYNSTIIGWPAKP